MVVGRFIGTGTRAGVAVGGAQVQVAGALMAVHAVRGRGQLAVQVFLNRIIVRTGRIRERINN